MSEQTPETATETSVSASASQEAEEIVQVPADWERRALILSFWAVVLCGLPWWFQTTRLVRLPLPTAEIQRWKAMQPDVLSLPLDFRIADDQRGELATALQQLPGLRQANDAPLSLTLVDADGVTGTSVEWSEDGNELVVSRAAADDLSALVRSALDARIGQAANDARVIKYSQRVKLVFSLLHQDNAAEHSGESPGWAFWSAFDEHILPLLAPLADLHDFTVETQVQHFAPLSFEPERLEVGSFAETIKLDPYGDGKSWIEQPEGLSHLGTVIEEDQLKAFVNSADWPLASAATNDSILHFLLFVPTPDRRPMLICDAAGDLLESTAFLVPQWGGVVIANPTSSQRLLSSDYAAQYFAVFAHQLQTLLGVPEPDGQLRRWQVETMTRQRTMEAAREAVDTLVATEQLAREVKRLRIGEEVRSDIVAALADLEKAQASASLPDKLRHARSANVRASRAFFHPSMMGILYFPDEHLYAIYLPLFGPIGVPLFGSLFKELRAYRKRRGVRVKSD